MDRRTFLVASTSAAAAMTYASARSLAQLPGNGSATTANVSSGQIQRGQSQTGKAKSTILFFLSGGASHLDMWDMKPQAPLEYRGPFQPLITSSPEVRLCEHLPLLAKQAHHLALINSVGSTVSTNDHHAGYYYNLTGHVPDQTFLSLGNNRTPYPDDWPYMGAVVAAKRPAHPHLTNAITLPHVEGAPTYTRPGQFAARIGTQFDPLVVNGSREQPLKFQVPALTLEAGMTAQRLNERHQLLHAVDRARRNFDTTLQGTTWHQQQDRALTLLMSSSTADAFNIAQEPEAIRQRYGEGINGTSLLLARRLVEAGVPFITVFWMGDLQAADKRKCASGGGWDTHGNNFGCLKEDLLPQFDQGFSALVEDLAVRGLLDQTLLLVTSEMGRKPKIGDPRSGGVSGAGRDHWTHCLTDVMAGGGIRGGQTYGTSDRLGEYPALNPVTPADVTKTVFHAMGISDLTAQDNQGRPYQLLDEGKPILELM